MTRRHRAKRRQRLNRRPTVRAMASRTHRDMVSTDELDKAIKVSMEVGVMQGRKWGERDLYRALAELLDEPLELIVKIGSRALVDQIETFLLCESARRSDPEAFHRLAEAVEDGEEAIQALCEEWGVTPADDDHVEDEQ